MPEQSMPEQSMPEQPAELAPPAMPQPPAAPEQPAEPEQPAASVPPATPEQNTPPPAAPDQSAVSETPAPEQAAPEQPAPPVDEALDRARLMDALHTLLDVMGMPDSAAQPQERALAADALLMLLPKVATPRIYAALGRRLCLMERPPLPLLNAVLACGLPDVTGQVLADARIPERALLDIVAKENPEELRHVVRRRNITTALSDALVRHGGAETAMRLLRNRLAAIHEGTFWRLLSLARDNPALRAPMATREDLPATVAFELFWYLAPAQRRHVLSRFLGDSGMLGKLLNIALPDRPALPREDRVMRTESMIELIIEGDLESAAHNMARLSGLDQSLCARVIADASGEPLAVMVKALGYSRTVFPQIIARLIASPASPVDSARDGEELQAMFDVLSTGKAWMLLLYWDWAARRAGPYANIEIPR